MARPQAQAAFGSGGWLVGPGFLLLAAWLTWGPELASVPDAATPGVRADELSIEPMRKVLDDPPTIHINSFDRTCMECHRTFLSDPPRNIPLEQHGHIALDHGINTSCIDCHDWQDRDLLVQRDGTTLPYGQVVTLCSQCHPTLYEDWTHGVHGRVQGYWNEALGAPRKLICTECHDPHIPRSPARDPLAPLPGPNSLRQGDVPDPGEHLHGRRDPLMDFMRGKVKALKEHR